jgi:hypothetical protein
MLLFTMLVSNEYTAEKLVSAAKKLKTRAVWQWVRTTNGKQIACDFFSS